MKNETIELFTLGELYVSDFVKEGEQPRGGKHDLRMVLEEDTGLVRLATTVPLNTMFGKYWYKSGINDTMKRELNSIVQSIWSVVTLNDSDLWIDIASNDGTLLSFVPNKMLKVGIDPADDNFKEEAEQYSDYIIQDYFSADIFKKSRFGNIKAKVITSIAMFYDLENPTDFCKDIYDILDDNGLWVMQLSYTPLMIQQLAFDNILSEHVYYYSLYNLKKLLNANGFKIMDCQLNDVNGGSFRVYIMKEKADDRYFATRPYRDVCKVRVNSLLEYEKSFYDLKETSNDGVIKVWDKFNTDIQNLKDKVVSFIKEQKSNNKIIMSYAASTKGNTLLQYFGLDNTLIDAIADRNTSKWGLRTVGSNIPIISEDEMRRAKPDFVLVLAWHFIDEFIKRENEYLKNGGKFIVPCPDFNIVP